MENFPSGTVTFLFTDIEGSTKLAQQYPEAMPVMLARHREILQGSIQTQNGYIFQVVGDSFSAAFHSAKDALNAALDAQRQLYQEDWGSAPIKVRMGIHTGAAQLADDPNTEGPYAGYATLALTQRLMSAAHGGQILLSQSTYELMRDELVGKSQFMDMGEHHLKSILRPVHLYQLNVDGLPFHFPPLKTLDYSPHNLPEQLSSFIGREKEIDEIKGLLRSGRLVTLMGSGGTGKTRLSQAIGAQELINFPNGVWLIELASLTDPAQIIPAMAQVFGLQELPFSSLTNVVIDYLRDKHCLLILDNCEHLIQACAHLADDLLHQCAGLKMLTSSREALGIAGEVTYHVPSLEDSESTQLFVDRARAVHPNFKLTDANAASIAQICSRLDGIPLAIELAAARVKLLSPEQIAARLDDRFRLLVGGSRTALPRQQTLRALIDWSYDLLSDEEKRLLQFASVFIGGWTLEALEAVAGDPNTLEHLEQLVNKSLVVTEEREAEMRYSMLETIRQYAREKLFEAKQASVARDRHFFYFNQLSETLYDGFRSKEMLSLFKQTKDEAENLRAAQEWGLENHPEENVRLAANLCLVSNELGVLSEGAIARTAVARARALPPVEGEAHIRRQKLIARALFAQGMVGFAAGNMLHVVEDLKEAITTSRRIGDKQMLGYSLLMYYTATRFIPRPNRDEAVQGAREGFHIFNHEFEDNFGLGLGYMAMSRIASEQGNDTEKEMYLRKIREIMSVAPSSYQTGMFHLSMGMDESARGNYETAKRIFEEGLKFFKGMSSLNFQIVMKSEIGHIERRTGNFPKAKAIYQETIKDWQELGNRAAIAHQLECFGFIAIVEEEPARAVKLFGAAQALRERIHSQMTDNEQVEYDLAIAQVRSMLTETEVKSLGVDGQSMTMEQAIELALEKTYE